MPSSVRSTCSSSADRRRLSQSLNRVAVLGHLSGIDTAVLPPFRTDSPMTVMQDRLRELFGAPSIESLNSVDAVVTQVARPRAADTDDARTVVAPPPLTGPESGRRHGQQPFQRRNSLALGESAPSQRSTGSGRTATTSRSRARKETLSRQQAEQHQHQPTVVSRPPLSHPELMTPGHARARSEAAVRMGSTARKRQSMAMKGGQGRQSLAAPQPDWVAQTLQGSRFASNGSSAVPRTAPQQQPQAKSGTSTLARTERRSVGDRDSDSRRSSSAATVVPETYAPAAVPTTMSIVQNARSRSRASQSVVFGEDGDDMQSVYSARSAATTSYAPRNFSRPMEKKQQQQQQNIVRAQGVEFELLNHLRSSDSRTATMKSSSSRASSFRALSVVIPPSQSAASSFSVRSVTRSTTPPLPTADVAPSPARTTSTSSRESTVFSDATCTRSSTVSSNTTVSSSRSPSPAPGSYEPVPDKTIIPKRVAQASDSRQHRQKDVQQHPWSVESRDSKTLRDPRRSVMPPVTSARGLASFSNRAVAMAADDRHRHEKTLAPARMNRTQPPTHPDPLAYHPIELAAASSRQQQEKQKHTIVKPKPYLLREEAVNVVEQRRAESPPAFDNDNSLQRSDSLFLPGGSKGSASSSSSSSRMRDPPAQHEFFPSWTQHQQARSQVKTVDGVGIQPYRKLEGLVPRAADDRRMLPSQSPNAGVLPHACSLQRVAATNAHVARGLATVTAAARPMGSKSLRKTRAIDFTKRGPVNNQ